MTQNVAVLTRSTYQNVAVPDRTSSTTVLSGSDGADTAVLSLTTTLPDSGTTIGLEGPDTAVVAANTPNIASGGGEIPVVSGDDVTVIASEGADTGSAVASSSISIELVALDGSDTGGVVASDVSDGNVSVTADATENADFGSITASVTTSLVALATEGGDTADAVAYTRTDDTIVHVGVDGEDLAVALVSTRELGFSELTLSPVDIQRNQTATATITVKDQFGNILPNYPVEVTTGNSLVALVYDGETIANSSGVATRTVTPVGVGQVTVKALVGSYIVTAQLGVFDRLMTVGDVVTATLRVLDQNGRPKSGVLVSHSVSNPGVVSVAGIGATNSSGVDTFTITGVGVGETELSLAVNGRRSNSMRIKVR